MRNQWLLAVALLLGLAAATGCTSPQPARAPAGMALVPAVQNARLGEGSYERTYTMPHRLFVALYEVSSSDYLAFCTATSRATPSHWTGGQIPEGRGDHPVTNVAYEDARAFCAWKRVRLPTEEEWEIAARGADGRAFPWGADFDAAKCNHHRSGRGTTEPVTSHPEGASPYGCLNMAGNVWEWTSTRYSESPEEYIIKGGSFFIDSEFPRASLRGHKPPATCASNIGFRYVRDVASAQ